MPRGVGNAYQALEAGTCYTYLVNEHWSAEARSRYTFTNLAHPDVEWPIPLSEAVLSEADRTHPVLADVRAFKQPRPLVTGAGGQLGQALRQIMPEAVFLTRDELDITDADAVGDFDFSDVSAIVNAAAWTDVDSAETGARAKHWAVNVTGPANLVAAARRHRLPLVHISSDYSSTVKARFMMKTSRHLRCRSTEPPKRRATPWWRPGQTTTSCAPVGWSETARTSCAPWPAWQMRAIRPRWSTTNLGGSPSQRTWPVQ